MKTARKTTSTKAKATSKKTKMEVEGHPDTCNCGGCGGACGGNCQCK